MNTNEVLKTDKKLHDFLQDHLLRGRVEKIMVKYHKEKIKEQIKDLLEEANKQKDISMAYLDQKRFKEQQYHYGRYTGLRDAATKLELLFCGLH